MTWQEAVQTVSKWYAENVNTYQGGPDNSSCDHKFHWRDCSLLGVNIQDDCGGLVSACLAYAGIIPLNKDGHVPYTSPSSLGNANGSWADKLKAAGFTPLSFNGVSSLQPFDIIACSKHTEIYAGDKKAYSWGNNHNISRSKGGGLPCYYASMEYTCVWRLNGQGNFTAATNGGASSGVAGAVVASTPPNAPRPIMASRGKNTVYNLAVSTTKKANVVEVEEKRRDKFSKIVDEFANGAPELGRDIVTSKEMFGSEILKGNQDAKTFLKKRKA